MDYAYYLSTDADVCAEIKLYCKEKNELLAAAEDIKKEIGADRVVSYDNGRLGIQYGFACEKKTDDLPPYMKLTEKYLASGDVIHAVRFSKNHKAGKLLAERESRLRLNPFDSFLRKRCNLQGKEVFEGSRVYEISAGFTQEPDIVLLRVPMSAGGGDPEWSPPAWAKEVTFSEFKQALDRENVTDAQGA